MGNIVLLDENTINKIAAGEVVDRPASIVKELVENSIDAGAKNITVEIKNGGISYIKILDDGIGIAADDIEMAFERHATSKIRTEEDIHKIRTMGFRGEALASVAAISKINITTRNINENIGTRLDIEAGTVISKEQIASKQGTVIVIKDVFFNVPARYKFLKKDYTEAGYIEDVIRRTALINPGIVFKYINNGKVIIQTSPNSDLNTTVFSIFGKEVYQNIEEVNYEYQGIKVTGVIGNPKISRSTRTEQYTYINKRYIKNKTITTAIDKSYAEELAINKFAFCILNVDITPEFVDVNVHPAKLEVKFQNEQLVFEAVYSAIKNSLKNYNRRTSPFANTTNNTFFESKKDNVKTIDNTNTISSEYSYNKEKGGPSLVQKEIVKEITDKIQEERKNIIKEFTPYVAEKQQTVYSVDSILEQSSLEKNIPQNEQNRQIEHFTQNNEIISGENLNENTSILQKQKTEEEKYFKYVGNVFDTYIIIEIKDKMYIIDQHAAHERLLYEQIKQKYNDKEKETQMLLIPILVELKNKEKEIVKNNIEMFEKVGYIIEDFGENEVKISGVPNIGYDIDFKGMFIDTIDELMGASKTETTEKEFRFLATLACKAAVKGNMKLTKEEQISLIEKMMKLDRPFTCPHGRPTAQEMSKYEIERKFLRK